MSNTLTRFGNSALANNTTGANNSAFGHFAAYSNTDGSSNTAIGANSSFYNVHGEQNTAIGAGSMCNNVGGDLNTAVGSCALEGPFSLGSVGDKNVAIGAKALYDNQGNHNVAVGCYALIDNTDGSGNTAVGYQAGRDLSGNSNFNTFLGYNTDINSNTLIYNNSTALGYNATIDASNQIVLGGQDPSIPVPYPGVYIPGSYVNIGGTYDPSSSYVLDVSGNVNASNYLTNYSSLPTFTSNMIGYSFSSGLVTLTPVTWNVNGVAITNFAFPSLGVFLVNFTVGVTTTTTSINQSLSFAGIKTAIGNSFVNNQYVEFQMPTYQYISTPLFYSSGSLSLTINVTSTTTQYYIVNQTNNFNIDILGCTYNYVKIA